MSTPTTRELISSLTSDLCPICGGWKRTAQTMCPADYRKLPRPMQLALYDRVGSGYEEAVAAAMKKLGTTKFKTARTS